MWIHLQNSLEICLAEVFGVFQPDKSKAGLLCSSAGEGIARGGTDPNFWYGCSAAGRNRDPTGSSEAKI